jgi:hypothetical protein
LPHRVRPGRRRTWLICEFVRSKRPARAGESGVIGLWICCGQAVECCGWRPQMRRPGAVSPSGGVTSLSNLLIKRFSGRADCCALSNDVVSPNSEILRSLSSGNTLAWADEAQSEATMPCAARRAKHASDWVIHPLKNIRLYRNSALTHSAATSPQSEGRIAIVTKRGVSRGGRWPPARAASQGGKP